MNQASFFAYAVIFSWPLVNLALFGMLPARLACVVSIVAGEMFLPSNSMRDIPLLSSMDKDVLSSLCALVACLILKPRALLQKTPGARYNWFFLFLLVGSFMTTMTNGDALRYGPRVLPGETFNDFRHDIMWTLLTWWTPFFLGRKLLSQTDDLKILFKTLAIGGLVYSLFIFIEVRMSPQLNMWVYGYHQSSFLQTVRFGGYRPKVFMRHGLNVALFMLMTTMAATALWKARARIAGLAASVVAVYLTFVLVLCKSSGAVIYGLLFAPILIWARSRFTARFTTVAAVIVFTYPLMRTVDLVPVESVLKFFGSVVGPERTQSLEFRFINERALLTHAIERPWFGWGGYARQFVFDPQSGRQANIVDGYWIGIMGAKGMAGFIAIFGLLLLPIVRFGRTLRTLQGERRYLGAAVLIMSTIYVVDLIPNAGVSPYLTMMVGCLAGLKPESLNPVQPATYHQPQGIGGVS